MTEGRLYFVMPNQIAANPEDGLWESLPDHILLEVFYFLKAESLLQSAMVCSQWRRVAHDDFLWKNLACHRWNIKRSLPLAPRRRLWLEEYKRLYYHTPCHETEALCEHRDQVLHISFSHNGKYFATSSKDGYVKVWAMDYPCKVVYSEDMRIFTWKYTQFTQFNKSDKLLLVSGVHFGSHSTSGEIAIFNMEDNFKLECRVQNKPYDIFGTWYNETHLLSGNLHWLGNFTSCSVLWLNKAYQALESEWESVVMRLYKFQNVNASSIRTILVADCLDTAEDTIDISKGHIGRLRDSVVSNLEGQDPDSLEIDVKTLRNCLSLDCEDLADIRTNSQTSVIEGNGQHLLGEGLSGSTSDFSSLEESSSRTEGLLTSGQQASYSGQQWGERAGCVGSSTESSDGENKRRECDKYLIFTTGSSTYTPHHIGIKRMRHEDTLGKLRKQTEERENYQAELSRRRRSGGAPAEDTSHSNGHVLMDVDQHPNQLQEEDAMRMDPVDHLIEMNGHIIGFCLSQDNRYLYVNTRAWPANYQITDPLEPPPIAQEIEIHVIDLLTVKDLGVMHLAHKAFTPNDECFFIFLDVCQEYVSSGAEDQHAYLWDRHYRSLINTYSHDDVVNSVAFCPRDPETLVTVSDDKKIKVWRSKNRCREKGIVLESKEGATVGVAETVGDTADHKLQEGSEVVITEEGGD